MVGGAATGPGVGVCQAILSVGPREEMGAQLTAPSPRRCQAGVRTFLPVPTEAVFLQLVRQCQTVPLSRAPRHRAAALVAASVPGQRPCLCQRGDHCVGPLPLSPTPFPSPSWAGPARP